MKRGSWWADGGGEVIRRIAPADEKRGEMRGEMRREGEEMEKVAEVVVVVRVAGVARRGRLACLLGS